MDERLDKLCRWAERILGSPVDPEPASADASFRRYFRVAGGGADTYILMDAPPERESVTTFARTAARFAELGLNVPLVYARDPERGFALLSDLGGRTYLDALTRDNADALYGDALEALWRLQTGSLERQAVFDVYDTGKLMQEMELFRQWFVPCTGRALSGDDNSVIDRTFERLAASAVEQPRVWVHRDFHSRNLMVTHARNPGILDFQDAVSGPVTYDLVSLLRDCYITWPEERIDGWLDDYLGRIRAVLPGDADAERFRRWFDWMGVQRHVKVLGIFSRLYHRDAKPNYLDDLPVVHNYVCTICRRYPALRSFGALLESMDGAWTS